MDRASVEIFGNNVRLYVPLHASDPVSHVRVSLACTGAGEATFTTLTVNKTEIRLDRSEPAIKL